LKQLDQAMKIQRNHPEYHLLAGECKMMLGSYKEAGQYFTSVVKLRPRNSSGWEALIRCLYKGEYFEDALEQTTAALKITNDKPLFLFYKASVLIASGKTKEGILQLERAMEKAPRLLKRFVELNPSILQNQSVVDVIARYKRNKSI
jgi:tetratricopeptide (TPR) repeat protein